MLKKFRFNRKVFALPYVLILVVLVILPLLAILMTAFKTPSGQFTFDNFKSFFTDGYSLPTLGKSIAIGFATTVLCLVIGYPAAYILSNKKYGVPDIFLILIIMPMWINMLLRTLSTKVMLAWLGSDFEMGAVLFAMVYNFLPFMILPLHTTLSSIDKSYIEAAQDLGASPAKVMLKTIIPLSLPGVLSGITMVFVPTISTFVISYMISGGKIRIFGDLINTQFSTANQGVGSVLSIVMLLLVIISNIFLNKMNKGAESQKEGLW